MRHLPCVFAAVLLSACTIVPHPPAPDVLVPIPSLTPTGTLTPPPAGTLTPTPLPAPTAVPTPCGPGAVTTVAGAVTDDTGANLDGATVRAVCLEPDFPYAASTTTANGRWTIPNLPTGRDVWISVFKRGWRQEGRTVYYAGNSCDRHVVDFKAPKLEHQVFPAYGTVYDRAGKPVPNVLVRVTSLEPGIPFTDYALTSATGAWALGVPDGPNFEVVVSGKGWQDQRRGGSTQTMPIDPVQIDFGGPDAFDGQFALGPALPPCGPGPTVVITGTAPAYTTIRAVSLDPGLPYTAGALATLGRWSITNLPAGTDVWLSSAPGQGQVLNIAPTDCKPHGFDLPAGQLAHPQTVVSTVYDRAGKPVPDALVKVTSRNAQPPFLDYARTNPDGLWWLTLPFDAPLDVVVTKPGYAEATRKGIQLTDPNQHIVLTLDLGGPSPTSPALAPVSNTTASP